MQAAVWKSGSAAVALGGLSRRPTTGIFGDAGSAAEADVTAVWTLAGWPYLVAVLDLYDRQLVGQTMAEHLRTELALAELDMGAGRPRRPAVGRLHHGERDSQYASRPCWETLVDVRAIASDAH